jgi:two-component system response regulator MprA
VPRDQEGARRPTWQKQTRFGAWGAECDGTDSVLDVYIRYLRAKTEAGGEPRLIQTVRGVGYVLRTG